MNSLLKISHLKKHFNGITALDDFSCEVREKELVGLIGPNGAGKTTLFNVLTGFVNADSGSALFRNKNIIGKKAYKISQTGISRTFQILRLIKNVSVIDNVMMSFHHKPGENLVSVFFQSGKSKQFEKEIKSRAEELLDFYGLAEKINSLASDLSYGQQKLLSIICAFASDPSLLLLDEPVAGLNSVMIDKVLEIVTTLPEKGKTVILIEHNMDVINKVCERIVFMNAGKKIIEGTPEEVRNDSRVLEAYLA